MKRVSTINILMVFTMAHVFSKCLGVTLLWCTFGGATAGSAWALEVLLYVLFKCSHGDLLYWIPIDNRFVTPAALHNRTIRKQGNGRLYWILLAQTLLGDGRGRFQPDSSLVPD